MKPATVLVFLVTAVGVAPACGDDAATASAGGGTGSGSVSGPGGSGQNTASSATSAGTAGGEGGSGGVGSTSTGGGEPLLDPTRCGDLCERFAGCDLMPRLPGCELTCPFQVPAQSSCASAFEDYVACVEASNCEDIQQFLDGGTWTCEPLLDGSFAACRSQDACTAMQGGEAMGPDICPFSMVCGGNEFGVDCVGDRCTCLLNGTEVGQCAHTGQICGDRPAVGTNACCGFQLPG